MPGKTSSPDGRDQPKMTIKLGKRKAPSTTPETGVKKIKLTTKVPSAHEDHADTPASRPKRHAPRPSRYSEASALEDDQESAKPATKKVRSPKTSPKAASRTTTPVATTTITNDDDDSDNLSAGYSADFLTNFIDDTPPTTPSAGSAEAPIAQAEEKSGARRESAPIQKAADMTELEPARRESAPITAATDAAPTTTSKSKKASTIHGPAFAPGPAYYASLVNKPPVEDDEDTMIKKLATALYALGQLGVQAHVHTDFQEAAMNDQGPPAPEPAPRRTSLRSDVAPASQTGTPDTDLRILIHNVSAMLRGSIVSYTNVLNSQPRKGKSKRDTGPQAQIDALRFAMNSLETLSNSSAMNVNCVVPSRRFSMLFTLYTSLLGLIVPDSVHRLVSSSLTASGAAVPSSLIAGSPAPAYANGSRGSSTPVPHGYSEQSVGATPHQFVAKQASLEAEDAAKKARTSMPPPPLPVKRTSLDAAKSPLGSAV